MLPVAVVLHNTTLTALQVRAVFRAVGYTSPPTDDVTLSETECLQIWVFMLLGRLNFLAPEQRNLLFEEMLPALAALGPKITDSPASTPVLVVGDGRYATWYTHTGWLDLLTGDVVKTPLSPILETVAYNLCVLFRRNLTTCREIARQLETSHAEAQR
jgi:hypothetical protein